MAMRGPDGEGSWYSQDRRIGLVHRRLAIIDLSQAGAQPMRDDESGTTIVFNGEIYNHRDLREDLVARGHVFRSSSDTEVLLKLYAEFGHAMPSKLVGMYAFAIFDERNEGLVLARDPFGMKPLYLADDGKALRFASQVKALLATDEIDCRPDPAGQVGFFLWGHIPEPFTLYRSIRAMPAGSSLWIDTQGRHTATEFYNIARRIEEIAPDSNVKSAEDARAVMGHALRSSVRRHLIADVPVGLFLSSGIDSAALLALSCEVGSQAPRAVTLGYQEFDGGQFDETPLSTLLAREYDADHQISRVTVSNFQDSFDHLLDSMDQPSIDGVNTYFVCKAARDAGLKVAMSGVGADELLAGYGDFKQIPRIVRTFAMASKIPGLGRAFRRLSAPGLKRLTSPKYASIIENGRDTQSAYLLFHALFLPWELNDFMDPDVVRDGLHALNTNRALQETMPNVADSRLQISGLLSAWYMRNQLLRDSDWASMCHSLELRTPFVDVDLWETVIRLVKSGFPVGKADLALAPTRHLPDQVVNRPKTGFCIPVREWLLATAPNDSSRAERGLRGWSKLLGREFGAMTFIGGNSSHTHTP